MFARKDQFKDNPHKQYCYEGLSNFGISVEHLANWQGDFTWGHKEALRYLILERKLSADQAVLEVQNRIHGEAYGISKGLSYEEVRGFNLFKVNIYLEFKDEGISLDFLRAQQKIDSEDNRNALRYLLKEKHFSIRRAMIEIDQLDCREAYGVAGGLKRQDVIGLNMDQIYALIDLKPLGLTADILKDTHFGHQFGYGHTEALRYLMGKREFSVRQALEAAQSLNLVQLREIALGKKTVFQQGLFAKSPEQQPVHIPEYFMCPISHEIMKDPVMCILDGHTYDRANIEEWLTKNGTSPMNRKSLNNLQLKDVLFPNRNLQGAIEAYNQTLNVRLNVKKL